jgi:hypothetical protein
MTDQEQVALLRRALKGMLAVIHEGCTEGFRVDEERIVNAHEEMAVTWPTMTEEKPVSRAPNFTLFQVQFIDEGGDYSTHHFTCRGRNCCPRRRGARITGTARASGAKLSRLAPSWVIGWLGHRRHPVQYRPSAVQAPP